MSSSSISNGVLAHFSVVVVVFVPPGPSEW